MIFILDNGNSSNNMEMERNSRSPISEDQCDSKINHHNNPFVNSESSTEWNHFIKLTPCNKPPPHHPHARPVYFFDLDNTLYPKSSGIAELMVERIELFFQNYLKLPLEESRVLGARFYKDYGLAIKGLIKHFSIDPAEYDKFVDGRLPLEQILRPNPELTALLHNLSLKGACYVFTNAGKGHASRVLKLLGINDYFSGIIYCDYSEPDFPSKPNRSAFTRAMHCANVSNPRLCYFFDDSIGNIRSAIEMGWNAIYIDEDHHHLVTSTENENNNIESVGEINVQLDISTDLSRNNNETTYSTVKTIQDIEKFLK